MLFPDVGAIAASAILAAGGTVLFWTSTASASTSTANGIGAHLFDAQGKRIVTRCAQYAQDQRLRNRSDAETRFSSVSSPAKLIGIEQLASDANESYLNGLPVDQARYETAQRRGAFFCRSGSWLEIGDESFQNEDAETNDEFRFHQRYKDEKKLKKDDSKAHKYIRGVRIENTRFALLELLAVAFGLVSIRGVASQNFLCMDSRGELYAANISQYSAECVFMEEMLENYYNLYSSCAYGTKQRSWYVALHKTGRTRRGRNTRKKQKSSHFLITYMENFGDENENANDRTKKISVGNGDALFASYNHAATRVQHQLLMADSGSDPTRWKMFYGIPSIATKEKTTDESVFDEVSLNEHNMRSNQRYGSLENQENISNSEEKNNNRRIKIKAQENNREVFWNSQQKKGIDHFSSEKHQQGRKQNFTMEQYKYSVKMTDSELQDDEESENQYNNRSHYNPTRYYDIPFLTNTSDVAEYFPKSFFHKQKDISLHGDVQRRQRLLREERRRKLRKQELEALREMSANQSQRQPRSTHFRHSLRRHISS